MAFFRWVVIVGSAGLAHIVDTRGLIPFSYFLYIRCLLRSGSGMVDGIAWLNQCPAPQSSLPSCPDLKHNGDDHAASCGDTVLTKLLLTISAHRPCARQYQPCCITSPSLGARCQITNCQSSQLLPAQKASNQVHQEHDSRSLPYTHIATQNRPSSALTMPPQ